MRRESYVALIALLALVLMVVMVLDLVGCGPVTPPPRRHFVVIVHSVTTSPDDVTLRWAIGGRYVGSTTRTLPAGGEVAIVMGLDAPELVEFDSLAFATAWGPPDWGPHHVWHVVYPTRATWSDY